MPSSCPLAAAVFAALLRLPADALDADEPDRPGRLGRVAEAVALATTDPRVVSGERPWRGSPEELAAALVTIGFHESRFAERIHAGQCLPHECDPYRDRWGVLRHRARSVWQMHDTGLVLQGSWATWVSTEQAPTTDAAINAARIISRARRACGADPATWFSYYGTGGVCRPTKWWPEAEKRRRFHSMHVRRIDALVREQHRARTE